VVALLSWLVEGDDRTTDIRYCNHEALMLGERRRDSIELKQFAQIPL
jgi:hypothetical protein